MALMGTSEIRLKCLELSAKINRRMSKEDPVTDVDKIIQDAMKMARYARRGEHGDD